MDIEKLLLVLIILIYKFSHLPTVDGKKLRIPPITTYLIEDDVCHVPYFDPWAFKDRYENKSYVPCPEKERLVYFDTIDDKIYAFINDFNLTGDSSKLSCCISNITRNLSNPIPDNSIRESPCEIFENITEVKNEVVRTICFKDKKVKVYEDIHGLFVPKMLKNKEDGEGFTTPISGFSVLLIVIDSLSQNNFLRQLPNTHNFLVTNNYLNIKVYNQVGKDAFQNIIPLLTGHSHRLSRMKFGNPTKKYFDDYPFIWKDFEDNGYITAYAQDFSKKHCFNEKKLGFYKSPTNYYFRSYTMSFEKLDGSTVHKMPHCTGSFLASERILNLVLDFAKNFHRKYYFGLFWLNTFSGEDFNAPGRVDDKLLNFFTNLHNFLEETIVFFLSDNGYYKENITNNIYGWFESRNPFLYIHVPTIFRYTHPNKFNYLMTNSNKLISPYDIYATLQDILELSKSDHVYKPPRSCRNCNSIFRNLQSPRSCRQAGIDRFWCTCISKNYGRFESLNETGIYFVDV